MKARESVDPQRKIIGRTVWHYDAVESTNEMLKELLGGDISEGLVIWADRQASGKGRHGRAWASPLGGLYLSILLRPKETHAHLLGLLAGMPLVKTLRHFGVFAGLKWPNDAVFQDRKIAGILSEGVYRQQTYYVVLGVGVNTNVDLERLPPEVQARATTLKKEVSLFVSNEEFLDYFLEQLDDLYSRYQNTPIILMVKEYRGACGTIGRRVSVRAGVTEVRGKAYDVSPGGALMVVDDRGGQHEFVEGSVEYLL
jgi:BirA family biotin operon repressor/biotin-[acetyl-CoA-carboxylase] ligase